MLKHHCVLMVTGMAIILSSCQTVTDTRIPSLPVNIDLSNSGLWNTYGVAGFGNFRYFIQSEREPAGYPWKEKGASGFGGVLLIGGMDPYTLETEMPLAYDLACPVERERDIRVVVDPDTYVAVCPVCGSVYDVTMGGGAPMKGPATYGDRKYGLRRYSCKPTAYGGYIVTDLK